MGPRETDFGRLITAMVTPFGQDGAVDDAQAARLAQTLVENGSDSLVVSGTTGESPTLTAEEKLRLFRTVKAAVGDRAKVIGGTGNYSTQESIELTHRAGDALDGVLMVVPYYNLPPQEGLYRHFRAIAEHTSLPCIVYNVPSRTVRNLEAETTIRLAEDVPNIVGIKEAVNNLDQVAALLSGLPSDFRVWSGNDGDTFPMMALGAYGVVSVASHVVGRQIRRMIDLAAGGETAAAAQLHLHLLPLFKALFPPISPVSSPSAIKCALDLVGFETGGLRLPLIELPAAARERLQTLLATYEVDPLPVAASA
jgi:4-hydroxy-tetrahydrodipicolinate synthase